MDELKAFEHDRQRMQTELELLERKAEFMVAQIQLQQDYTPDFTSKGNVKEGVSKLDDELALHRLENEIRAKQMFLEQYDRDIERIQKERTSKLNQYSHDKPKLRKALDEVLKIKKLARSEKLRIKGLKESTYEALSDAEAISKLNEINDVLKEYGKL